MKEKKINREIVESARVFGQWLNQVAYNYARKEIGQSSKNRAEKIQQFKARVIKQIEHDTNNARTPQEMIYRTYMRINNASYEDVPARAAKFLDAVNSGDEISFTEARQMLIMYMRMRNDN
jgi:hypothetical protein